MDFYEAISNDYDAMTRFSTRITGEKTIMKNIVTKYAIKHALDAGCGSGLHAIILAQLGVNVVGIDSSPKMIETAQSNASHLGQKVDFIQSAFTDLDKSSYKDFDAIFCLGNVLPHILNVSDLGEVLKNFRSVLRSGGYCIFQILNYTKILKTHQRIVGITQTENKTFVRFYDFLEKGLRFNLIRIEQAGDKPKYLWDSTQLYPWQYNELEETLSVNGFINVRFYSNLSEEKYDKDKSENLVVFCQI